MSMRVAVFGSGRGSNLAALLQSLGPDAPARVLLVGSNRPDAGALEIARAAGLPAVVLKNSAEPAEWLALLERWRVELVVLAGDLKQEPPPVGAAYRRRVIYNHPAPLPAHCVPG